MTKRPLSLPLNVLPLHPICNCIQSLISGETGIFDELKKPAIDWFLS